LVLELLGVTLLDLQLPALAQEACPRVHLRVLLVHLFMLEYVSEEPLEDAGVAVDGDVDLVLVGDLLQALLEVLHVFDQQRTRKGEILLYAFAVVDYVDHYLVLEIHLRQHPHKRIRRNLFLSFVGVMGSFIDLSSVFFFLEATGCSGLFGRWGFIGCFLFDLKVVFRLLELSLVVHRLPLTGIHHHIHLLGVIGGRGIFVLGVKGGVGAMALGVGGHLVLQQVPPDQQVVLVLLRRLVVLVPKALRLLRQ